MRDRRTRVQRQPDLRDYARGARALERRCSAVGAAFGTTGSRALPGLLLHGGTGGWRRVESKVKINVKGSGQECPLHTSKSKIKGGAVGARGSHPCAKDAQEWGIRCDFYLRGIKIKINVNVKGGGRGRPLHTSNVKVKSGAAGVRGSHLSQKTRKMGHPL
jgi:hypothetical protein